VQAHVFQGMEPTYFCMLFRAQGLILYRHIVSLQGNRGQRLFHVQGTNPDNVRAMQVAPRASSLNSGDCFVFILSPDKLCVCRLPRGAIWPRAAPAALQTLHPSWGVRRRHTNPTSPTSPVVPLFVCQCLRGPGAG